MSWVRYIVEVKFASGVFYYFMSEQMVVNLYFTTAFLRFYNIEKPELSLLELTTIKVPSRDDCEELDLALVVSFSCFAFWSLCKNSLLRIGL